MHRLATSKVLPSLMGIVTPPRLPYLGGRAGATLPTINLSREDANMCGRYVAPNERALEQYWEIGRDNSNPFKGLRDHPLYVPQERINYNAVVTQMVPVERWGPQGRELVTMRWGMDRFQEDGSIAAKKLNNARKEGYKRTPPFAAAWKKGQRCIQLVMGYYEWKATVDGKKLPYYIRPSDQGEVFGLAGLWDVAADGSGLLTCTHITMPPNPLIASIHDRMPAILRAQDHEAWLHGTPEEAAACLAPYPAENITMMRVSRRVNSTKNNDEELIRADEEGE